MDADGLALARALCALPGWCPPPGALMARARVRVRVTSIGAAYMDWLPDLDDAATGGFLEAMLGEDGWRIVRRVGGGYEIRVVDHYGVPYYLSLGRVCATVMIERGWVVQP